VFFLLDDRTLEIKEKGFDMRVGRDANEEYNPMADYSKIKVGLKSLDSPLTDINFYTKVNSRVSKENVLKAIANNNYDEMRAFSEFFYKASGIYGRLCRYMAYLYRYDHIITPVILSTAVKEDKIIEGFYKSLIHIDNFNPKKVFPEISLKILQKGCYYGYKVYKNNRTYLQELPVKYCRSRFISDGKPVVEFNMRYFDDTFSDTSQRVRILKVFPPEFIKGYLLYKEGKLPADFMGDMQGWYLLDVKNTVKFNLNGEDYPSFISVIPAIIDLEEAQELDRKKMAQQLLKVIIQKMPMDKNGELIFDVDEARALHNNAVSMLGQAIGIDVLTTFAEVDVADLADKSTTTSVDELMKVERTVFNEAGVSQMQFNTDGNMALEKSLANDEASMSNLLVQFQLFLNELLEPFNKNPKKLYYRAEMLNTTIYNYKELSKLYKEQMALGFSKILPQVALGQSQSSILATAYFENEVLNLNELFTPPASSATTSGGAAGDPGRPEKPDEEKSDKTIQNRESMS
jgi:hypothetical protein